jgi:hypothetical protein
MAARLQALSVVALLAIATAASGADLVIYDDQSRNGFDQACTWGTADFASTDVVRSGAFAIRFVPDLFRGLSWCTPAGGVSAAGYRALRFWVHGGGVGGQDLRLALAAGSPPVEVASATVAQLLGGPIPAGTWTLVDASFDAGPLAFAGTFVQFYFQDQSGGVQAAVYFDDLSLLERPAQPDPIFASGFEGGAQTPAIAYERDVTVDGMLAERWTWRDSGGQPRAMTLAHNDQLGPGGTRGGELRRFGYETPEGTRTVSASNGAFGGFGYVVSHLEDPTPAVILGQDDSPLGHFFAGAWTRVFEGRHHALLRFQQDYPRYYCTYDAGNQCIPGTAVTVQMPVTIEWMAATGRDHPLWTVTYDLSGAPADRVSADSRSPYGDLAFDGSPGAPDVVQAVGWGDRYRFVSTSAGPVTLNSPWTWNVPNTIPHTYLWTASVDAEMGIVLTQDHVQQDAGGYWGYGRWNTTSAAGNACLPPDGNHVMPCDFNWPFQTINYSFTGANTPTSSKRMAWGTNFGFLGRTSYPEHGFGGFRSGYPRQSYSVYVTLDRRTQAPTAGQVAQVEAALASALAADVGTVLTSGPAGVNRPDTLPYVPAGYNRVYGTWEVAAAAGAASFTFTAAGAGVDRPVFVLTGYTLPTPPASVRLDGVALAADVDYFASVDATRQRLWITVNRAWVGAHTLVVTPP